MCSPLQGTRNRRRSEMLLSHTRSDLRLPNQANSRIKDLRSRRVISFPSFETSAAKNGVLDSKNGGIECTPPRSNVVGEQHCDGSVSLGKTEGKNETMKSGIGSDAVSEEKVVSGCFDLLDPAVDCKDVKIFKCFAWFERIFCLDCILLWFRFNIFFLFYIPNLKSTHIVYCFLIRTKLTLIMLLLDIF